MPNKILPSSLSGSAKSLLFAQIHLSCALCPFLSYPTSLIYAPLPSQSCFSCCVFRYIRTPSKNLALGSHPHLIKVPLQRRINSSSALSPSYEVFVFSVWPFWELKQLNKYWSFILNLFSVCPAVPNFVSSRTSFSHLKLLLLLREVINLPTSWAEQTAFSYCFHSWFLHLATRWFNRENHSSPCFFSQSDLHSRYTIVRVEFVWIASIFHHQEKRCLAARKAYSPLHCALRRDMFAFSSC